MSVLSQLKLFNKPKLRMVFQAERSECGHACLAMVASWFGYNIDLTTLKKRFSSSIRGVSVLHLIKICEQLNLKARALRLEPETLNKIKTPAILHWNMNHFVVLQKVTKKSVVVFDPALGEKKYTMPEVSSHFTGIALEIIITDNFVPKNNCKKLTLRNFIGSISGWKKQIITILGFSFVIEIVTILISLFTQVVFDKVLPSWNISLLYLLSGFYLLISGIKVAADAMRNWTMIYIMNTLNLQINSELMKHMMRLPLDFFEKRSVGDILSRFYSTEQIQQKITTDFVQVLIDGIVTFITLAIMLVYSVKLTLIAILSLILVLIFRVFTYKKFKKHVEEKVICEAKEQGQIIETLRSMLPLTVFNKRGLRFLLWQSAHSDTLNATISQDKVRLVYSSASHLLSVLEHGAIIFFGAFLVLHQSLSMGMLVAFIAFATQFSEKVKGLVEKLTDYKIISLYLARLEDILFQEPEQQYKEQITIKRENIKGSLTVKDLSFRYDKNSHFLFKNISLNFTAKKTTAIIAPSGYGKTTLIKLLMCLLPIEDGTIFIDGISVNDYGLDEFRTSYGAVMQNDQLLSGTLLENICFFDENPVMQKIEQAAKFACIHNDIKAMAMGYNTLAGDLGRHLSGGQKQRLLIARALYHKPKILFMDEATSHLDENTERQVNINISALNITRIIIAHRQTTINSADFVIDLTKL